MLADELNHAAQHTREKVTSLPSDPFTDLIPIWVSLSGAEHNITSLLWNAFWLSEFNVPSE